MWGNYSSLYSNNCSGLSVLFIKKGSSCSFPLVYIFSYKWCLCHSHSVPRMLVLALYKLGWAGTISFEKCVTLYGTSSHTTNYGLKKKPDRYYGYYGRGEETVVVKIQTFMRDAGCNLIGLIPVSRGVVVFLYAKSHLTSVLSQACMQIKKLNSFQKVWSYFVNLTPSKPCNFTTLQICLS